MMTMSVVYLAYLLPSALYCHDIKWLREWMGASFSSRPFKIIFILCPGIRQTQNHFSHPLRLFSKLHKVFLSVENTFWSHLILFMCTLWKKGDTEKNVWCVISGPLHWDPLLSESFNLSFASTLTNLNRCI